jgi:hypothetical protein
MLLGRAGQVVLRRGASDLERIKSNGGECTAGQLRDARPIRRALRPQTSEHLRQPSGNVNELNQLKRNIWIALHIPQVDADVSPHDAAPYICVSTPL